MGNRTIEDEFRKKVTWCIDNTFALAIDIRLFLTDAWCWQYLKQQLAQTNFRQS